MMIHTEVFTSEMTFYICFNINKAFSITESSIFSKSLVIEVVVMARKRSRITFGFCLGLPGWYYLPRKGTQKQQ